MLGKHGQLYGNWKCKSCGHVKKFSTYSRCKTCDEPRVYDELEVKYRRTLVGHVDGLYYDEETKTYWVIDYKSTSSRQVWKHGQSGKVFPYRDNVAQIKAYVPLLEDEYGIKIAGYMLVYLPRDNPMDAKVVSIQPMSRKAKDKERVSLDQYVKTWRMMLLVKNKQQFKELYARKLCPTRDYYRQHVHSDLDECPYAGICFDSKRALAVGKEALGEKAYPMLMHAPMKIQKRLGLTLDTDNGGE